jgi:hypothetical protein
VQQLSSPCDIQFPGNCNEILQRPEIHRSQSFHKTEKEAGRICGQPLCFENIIPLPYMNVKADFAFDTKKVWMTG